MRIHFVRLFLGQQKLEAAVDVSDTGGGYRKVVVSWKTADTTDVPPSGWLELVKKEVLFQDRSGMENRIPWKPPGKR